MSEQKSFDCLDAYQMCCKAEAAMTGKASRAYRTAFFLAILAGFLIGLGFMYCGVANVWGAGKLVGGLVFSVGLMMVTILDADLFTGNMLAFIPAASKKISRGRLLANWGVVYAGNFVGSIFLVGLVFLSGHLWEHGGEMALWYFNTTAHKLSHTLPESVGLGMLCNILVCLAVWMTYSARGTFEKMLCCLLPVGLFVAGGFEHSVANMFMIPAAIIGIQTAPAEVLTQLSDAARMQELFTWGNFVVLNLIPVTIGNMIGGVTIGLFHWLIYLRPGMRLQAPILSEKEEQPIP